MTSIGLTLPHLHVGVGVGRTVHRLLARWRQARRIAEARRAISEMDDHMLRDLGVSRAPAYFEVDRASRWRRR
jgi:uncharacterized protein YjiS (DUF1127 family)